MFETLKAMVLYYSVYAICSGISSFLCSWTAENMIDGKWGLRVQIFNSLMHQEMAFHYEQSVYDLLLLFTNDCDSIRALLADNIADFAENLFLVAFGLWYMCEISWELTFYVLGIAPLAYGISRFQMQKQDAFKLAIVSQNSRIKTKWMEAISNFRAVLLNGKQDFEIRNFMTLLKLHFQDIRVQSLLTAIMIFFSGLLLNIAQPVTFALSIQIMKYGDFRQFATFFLLSLTLVKGLLKLFELIPHIRDGIEMSSDVLGIIWRSPSNPEIHLANNLDIHHGKIVFNHVNFTFPDSNVEVLSDVSFVIYDKTKVAIVSDFSEGDNPIFHLITKFFNPTSGSVLIDDQDIDNCNVLSVRSQIALVNTDLFCASFLENILYGTIDPTHSRTQTEIFRLLALLKDRKTLSRADGELITTILEITRSVNCSDMIEKPSDLPSKIPDDSDENLPPKSPPPLTPSQRFRISLSRALLKDTLVNLVEEPDAEDPVSDAIINSSLELLSNERTVIIATKKLQTLESADQILVFDKSRLVDVGKHAELLKRCSKYAFVVAQSQREYQRKQTKKMQKVVTLLQDIKGMIDTDDSYTAREIKKLLYCL
uniref:ABC transmembrane type-1 domain-containing protein n=1 Tax=Arcella intermedia TaxID=1963864 RepID=A0A6B2KZW7_9EUKA